MLELAIVAAAYYGDSILSNLAAYYSNSEQNGQSDGMGACRRTFDRHVFLCDEGYETQTWPVKIRKITRDLPKKTFFGDITCKQ